MTIESLSEIIAKGYPDHVNREALIEQTRNAITGLFGTRYQARSRFSMRVAFMPGTDAVSFAGLVHEESPTSGVYGGMSLIWFPVDSEENHESGSLLTFVCGTRGLAPDQQILGRPGHVRHLKALRRYLSKACGVAVWVKHDPTNLAESFPQVIRPSFSRFANVLNRYGNFIYVAVDVPSDCEQALKVVSAFVDFYAWERGWTPLKSAKAKTDRFKNALRSHVFPRVEKDEVLELLKDRRFVVLQGPPGTGKTRMAGELLKGAFGGRGMAVQFHPAVTYETFVAGIAPDVADRLLRFQVKDGWLVQASNAAEKGEFLLVIDEINRADLGRVLGEGIFLFEPREIAHGERRHIRLPQVLDSGRDSLEIPKGLFILGTMNNADRSIAIMDLAVRRRFAFVDVWPDLSVVAEQEMPFATEAFGRLQDVFAQYAPDEALVLVPGHAYFLANNHQELARRLRFELSPLLEDYLRQGRLGACESELRAYLDWMEMEIMRHGSES